MSLRQIPGCGNAILPSGSAFLNSRFSGSSPKANMTPLEQLTEFCEMTYGVPALHSRILASALLPTRYPPLWILIQSEWSRFFDHFSFVTRQLRAVDVHDTWHIRAERPRTHNRSVMIHLASRDTEPRFFADRYWRLPAPPIWRQSRYPLVAQESIRMRLEWDESKVPEDAMRNRFHALMCAALAAAPQDRGGIVPAIPSESFKRRVRILPLIDSLLADREALMRNLCYVPAAHAALYGREKPTEDDWRAGAHVLRSTVPLWMEKLIRAFLGYGALAISLRTAIADTGFDNAWRNTGGAIGQKRDPIRLGEKLVAELWINGLLDRNKQYRYKIKPEFVDDLDHILNCQL